MDVLLEQQRPERWRVWLPVLAAPLLSLLLWIALALLWRNSHCVPRCNDCALERPRLQYTVLLSCLTMAVFFGVWLLDRHWRQRTKRDDQWADLLMFCSFVGLALAAFATAVLQSLDFAVYCESSARDRWSTGSWVALCFAAVFLLAPVGVAARRFWLEESARARDTEL